MLAPPPPKKNKIEMRVREVTPRYGEFNFSPSEIGNNMVGNGFSGIYDKYFQKFVYNTKDSDSHTLCWSLVRILQSSKIVSNT